VVHDAAVAPLPQPSPSAGGPSIRAVQEDAGDKAGVVKTYANSFKCGIADSNMTHGKINLTQGRPSPGHPRAAAMCNGPSAVLLAGLELTPGRRDPQWRSCVD